MPHRPTAEQAKAVELFGTGKPLVIQAGAGAGKTTTLGGIARSVPNRPGTYLAFNKAIARDAGRSMPMGVQSTTMHSLAYRIVGDQLAARERLNQPRIASSKIARLLGINHAILVTIDSTTRRLLQPSYLAGLVMKAVTLFCQSARLQPTVFDFPRVPALDLPDANGHRTWRNNDELAKELLPYLLTAWADLLNAGGRLRFTHDVYFKAAQLAGVEMPGEYLLVDEAQDLNPVMIAWLERQRDLGKQLVFVGDSQQQIYEWRGAVDALSTAAGPDALTTYLRQSFRFGPAIAEVANAILTELDAELRLVGTPTIPSKLAHLAVPDAILCRSNAQAVHQVLGLQRLGLSPFLVGGSKEITDFTHAAVALQNGKTTNHPELACFENWAQVLDYVEADPQGDELRMLVGMLEDYGPEIVLEALSGLAGEDDADVVVSTAHKSKGREWPRVRLAPDFAEIAGPDGKIAPGEWRLLYVACTRAQHELDVTWATPVRQLLEAPAEVPA
jgi:superfamily I DNA/RNA helicase